MTGARKTPITVKNATPLYSEYNDANSLAALEGIGFTGPIPVKIILALTKLSNHGILKK